MNTEQDNKANRPSRSPESRRKRNLSFFVTVIVAIIFATWQISNT